MKSKKLTCGLFILYFAVLVWIVLFKFRLPFVHDQLPHLRGINLIPFAGTRITNGTTDFKEVIDNVIIFVPFGVLICTLWQKKSLLKYVSLVLLVSLSFEILQFVFAIGASDITDLIANTLGGTIGAGAYFILYKILGEKTNLIINILSLIFAVILTGLVLLITIANV